MGALISRIAQASFSRLGLFNIFRSHIDKHLAAYDRKQHKMLEKRGQRSDKYIENLKALASEQEKRLKTLERRLEANTQNIKEVAKLHKTSTRKIENLDKKAQLIVRVRDHDQLREATDHFQTLYPLSAVASHIERAISNAVLVDNPCPHTVIHEVLPENLYSEICANMPPIEFWREGRSGRDNWTIGEDTAPLKHEAAWRFMNDIVASKIMIPALVSKFDDYCTTAKPVSKSKDSSTSGIDHGMYDGRLMLRRPGYSLEPHVDPRRSLLTALLYMGTSSGNDDYGTKLFTSDREIPRKYSGIYYPLREGASCSLSKLVPCRANSMLVFASRLGIHGSDIPSDTDPPTLTRYTYHFFIGVNKHKSGTTE